MHCPICKREVLPKAAGEKSFAPFCSERCKLVDFQRWWQGKYVVVEDVDLANLPPDEYELMRDDDE